ncbi:MAG TPA: helix-turn-helix domain-containing protein [Planococcus sp. (in: firmicutes)]|nr:helix-turn-helix domain-containing protein [Planococcus sp. (in: firmicutes)]
MLFEELVISIMKAVNLERTVSSPFHLIKGKKSGQTIQDIGYYRLHPYFALMPKLDKKAYDEAIQSLFSRNLLRPNEQVIDLSNAALGMEIPGSKLNGWKYRGNEILFLNRLSLIVQTLSHTSQKEYRFDPVHNAVDLQGWVKDYLTRINFRDSETAERLKKEMHDSLEATAVPEDYKMMLMQRLTGLGLSGLTWEQIAAGKELHTLDVQLAVIETLHAWLEVLEGGDFPLLTPLLNGVVQLSSLTESAERTDKLFKQGLSLAEIAAIRQLKTSTIEDHFVELAMDDPSFDYTVFIPQELFRSITDISAQHNTKRLRDIKEMLPQASYFQIRLALAVKEDIS